METIAVRPEVTRNRWGIGWRGKWFRRQFPTTPAIDIRQLEFIILLGFIRLVVAGGGGVQRMMIGWTGGDWSTVAAWHDNNARIWGKWLKSNRHFDTSSYEIAKGGKNSAQSRLIGRGLAAEPAAAEIDWWSRAAVVVAAAAAAKKEQQESGSSVLSVCWCGGGVGSGTLSGPGFIRIV